jgi:DNA mismatch repair protein MLH3
LISLPTARRKLEDTEHLRSFQRSLNGGSTAGPWRTAPTQHLGIDGLTLSSSVLRAFSPEDLAGADVLGQVDCKFIACLVRSSASTGHVSPLGSAESLGSERAGDESIVILIDQHAADERVRVERLLRCICEEFVHDQVERRVLRPSATLSPSSHENSPSQGESVVTKILLTTSEAQALLGPRSGGVRSAFARWGLTFGDLVPALLKMENEQELPPFTQVDVYSVPDMIADKVSFCVTSSPVDVLHSASRFPYTAFYLQLLSETELQDLTKTFLAQLEEEGCEYWPPPGPMPPPNDAEPYPVDETTLKFDTNWTRALRWCPQDILDLINSKACRGAIELPTPSSSIFQHSSCPRRYNVQ